MTIKKQIKSKGFTLIELLVVIAIIGILATIVMVSLNTARSKARDAQRVAAVRQMQLALQMYYDSNGSYPAALADLTDYISAVPLDPDGSTSYRYCVTSSSYHLGTGVGLENAGGPLNSDSDVTADGCATNSFDGTDPVYDVIP